MTVLEFMQTDNMDEYTLYTVDSKHYLFKKEYAREYSTDLEIDHIDESITGKIVFVKNAARA